MNGARPEPDAPPPAWGALVGGEVVGAGVCPTSGLVNVAVRGGQALLALGVGIGPRAIGVGWLPRKPRGLAPRSHPLVAALRAHVVGRTVERVDIDAAGRLVLVCDGAPAARVLFLPGARGQVIVEASSAVVRWPRDPDLPATPAAIPEDLERAGAELLARSDASVEGSDRVALRRALASRRAALSRRVEAVRADLARVADAAELERVGQLLNAQAAKIPRGAKQAELDDWERGGKLSVTLDPARPARAQAEALFAKARRWRRGRPIIERRLTESLRELEELEALAVELGATPAGAPLDELTRRARSLGARIAGSDPEDRTPRALRTPPGERRPFHVYRAAGGRRVLVGRGGADNDALTTRYARPHDLWLHAKGRTGAHVVVPLDKGESCPSELLVDAATLAAHFSDARGEPICEVSHVPRRYVRKPKGSAVGAVMVDREKVMVLRIEPERLARLLAAREPGESRS